MRSFASAFIATALAAFVSAAPVSLPGGAPPLPNQILPLQGEVGSVVDAAHVRKLVLDDATASLKSEVHTRETTVSLAVVFENIITEVRPYVDQLTYLTPSNSTTDNITKIVGSIKGPIVAAIPQLKALAGQETNVILAAAGSSSGELTVSEIADIVGRDVKLIIGGVGHVLNIVKAESGDIIADVEDILDDLGNTVSDLLCVVVPLVDGLVASLSPILAPVSDILYELGLTALLASIGL